MRADQPSYYGSEVKPINSFTNPGDLRNYATPGPTNLNGNANKLLIH